MDPELKRLGMEALSQGRHRAAVAALQAYLQDAPADYEAETAVAMALFKLGRRDEASDIFAGLMARHPTSSSVRYHLGLALEEAGKLDAARRAYEAALELRPGFGAVKRRLAALAPQGGTIDLDDAHQLLPSDRKFTTLPEVDPEPVPPQHEVDIFESLPELDEAGAARLTKPASAPIVPFDFPPEPPAPRPEAKKIDPSLELEILPDLDAMSIVVDETPTHVRRSPKTEPMDDIFGESTPPPLTEADALLADMPIAELMDETPDEELTVAELIGDALPVAALVDDTEREIPIAALIDDPEDEIALAIPLEDEEPPPTARKPKR